jgi:hypothetical protein
MCTLVAYFDLNDSDLSTLTRASCGDRRWRSGKVVVTSISREEATRALQALRVEVHRTLSFYPRVITYGFSEGDNVALPIREIRDYALVFEAESREVIDHLIALRRELQPENREVLINALSRSALLDLVSTARIDNKDVTLKTLRLDLRCLTIVMERLSDIARTAESEISATSSLRGRISSALRKSGIRPIIGTLILGVVANAIFEYVVKPIVEILRYAFHPITISAALQELARNIPELQVLLEQDSPMTAEAIAKALGREEWNVLLTVNWLVAQGIVLERTGEDARTYSLSGKSEIRHMASCTTSDQAEIALVVYGGCVVNSLSRDIPSANSSTDN